MNKTEPKLIDNEKSYQQTINILNNQDRPSKILCLLMNMLESYRQAKKMGWSRPWNKYGLTTFQSFKLDPHNDASLSELTLNNIQTIKEIPSEALSFCHSLLTQPEQLMGFIFFSEYVEHKQNYETVTLSFGKKVEDNPRFRDRFDIIFDAPVTNGTSQALSRVRIFIDPYQNGNKEPLFTLTIEDDLPPQLINMFNLLCEYSWNWQPQEDKHWHHWTSRYIDYFGPRNFGLKQSHFYQEAGLRLKAD